MKNFLHVQLSSNVLILIAQDGEKMILVVLQVKKLTLISSAGYTQVIDNPTKFANNYLSCNF